VAKMQTNTNYDVTVAAAKQFFYQYCRTGIHSIGSFRMNIDCVGGNKIIFECKRKGSSCIGGGLQINYIVSF
jgi:hypothetical protein